MSAVEPTVPIGAARVKIGEKIGGAPPVKIHPTASLWDPVTEGFEKALRLATPGHPQRPLLAECYRLTCGLAGKRPWLALATDGEANR